MGNTTTTPTLQPVWTLLSDLWAYIFGGTPSGSSTEVTGFATKLVQWIIANPIALIPLGMYILVMVAGTIRRFIPGV